MLESSYVGPERMQRRAHSVPNLRPGHRAAGVVLIEVSKKDQHVHVELVSRDVSQQVAPACFPTHSYLPFTLLPRACTATDCPAQTVLIRINLLQYMYGTFFIYFLVKDVEPVGARALHP